MSSHRKDEKHDQAAEDSFPASDPPASTGITGPRVSNPRDAGTGSKGGATEPPSRGEKARPKGSPTDERHATESADQAEHEKKPGRSS